MSKKNSLDSLIAQYQKEGINRVKLVFADIDGVHRGKYISLEKFSSFKKQKRTSPYWPSFTFSKNPTKSEQHGF